ncbi:hypothetical protein FA13DRAFT_1790034 [Coprinellus micaceus]|uniref:F-box domain-containing protein n=1 Tax=Coprinellus micaceus TaxID=71717 RepID=A0A4Y7TI56_COPMI|nr:hypothetical protein FA13DRAFT_1790034 [Coprinellus micaceus]
MALLSRNIADTDQPFPIEDAPVEIFTRILDAAICSHPSPEEEYWGEYSHGDRRGAQRTVLRLVSPAWNSTVLNNPRFWNGIVLDFTRSDPAWDPLPPTTTVMTMTAASEWTPLWIPLSRPIGSWEEAPSLGRNRRRERNLRSTREVWDTVRMELDYHHSFISYLFNYQRKWTPLRSLTVNSTESAWFGAGSSDEPEVGPLVMQRVRFPALRHLCVDMTMVNLEGWNLPWGQLSSLKLRNMNAGFNDYLSILARASSLEIFHLTVPQDGLGRDSSLAPAPGTSIRVLRLQEMMLDMPQETPTICADFVDKLTLPALRAFTLRGRVSATHFNTSFENLLGRSGVPGRDSLRLDFEGATFLEASRLSYKVG